MKGKDGWYSWKFYLLLFMVIAAVLGISVFLLFDPIVLLSRTLSLLFFPWISLLGNGLLLVLQPAATKHGWYSMAYASFQEYSFFLIFLTLTMAGTLVVLGLVISRFWCRYLCPLGGLLGVFSARAPFRRVVDRDRCTSCGLCTARCVMGAIDPQDFESDRKECVECYGCLASCPERANSFRWKSPFPTARVEKFNLSRRGFIASGLAAFGAVILKSEGRRKNEIAQLVRPPGALPEALFLQVCLRCGLCMKGCLTNGLQPCFLEAGLGGLFTPRLVSRIGGCEDKCNLCGRVCPSGAIRPLPLEEKRFVKLGTAVIVKELCIVWEQKRKCLICDEACPYDAIEWRIISDSEGTYPRPFILEEKCTGCGLCEQRCPIEGRAAIIVFQHGEERFEEGSYVTDRKMRLREIPKDPEVRKIVEQWDWG